MLSNTILVLDGVEPFTAMPAEVVVAIKRSAGECVDRQDVHGGRVRGLRG